MMLTPQILLSELASACPGVWRAVEEYRTSHPPPSGVFMPPLKDWAQYLHLQCAGISSGKFEGFSEHYVAALATWRTTQGIYRFDTTLFEELWRTPISGKIPRDALRYLPEPCPYIEFAKPVRVGQDLHGTGGIDAVGVFCYSFFPDDVLLSLSFMFVSLSGDVLSTGILLEDTIDESVAVSQKAAIDMMRELYGKSTDNLYYKGTVDAISQALSLILYICSTSADIVGRDEQFRRKFRPVYVKTKRGMRCFGPEKPRVWDVGFRIGAELRSAEPTVQHYRGRTHASPRPHIRRAHWHAFWTGEKAKPGKLLTTSRRLILHWIHPLMIKKTDKPEDLIPVIRTVGGE